jgi:hypothetical protein
LSGRSQTHLCTADAAISCSSAKAII